MAAIGKLRISPADIGRRVSVRHFDGKNLTDVLGILVSWSGDWPTGQLRVRKKDESIQEIISGNIFAAKVIEPEIGCLDLERDSETTWVASEKEYLGDWALRYSGNKSARANSCLLDGRPIDEIDESFKKIIEWYRQRKAVAIIQTPKPGAFDNALQKNNFVEIDVAYYMIGPASLSEENSVIIDSQLVSDEIIFSNKILTDYYESIGNRVLSIDDISPEFSNSDGEITDYSVNILRDFLYRPPRKEKDLNNLRIGGMRGVVKKVNKKCKVKK